MRLRVIQVAATVAGLLGIVHAQGFYGSVEGEITACSGDNFVYLGCFEDFATEAETFSFLPGLPNPASPDSSFPGYIPGGSTLGNTGKDHLLVTTSFKLFGL